MELKRFSIEKTYPLLLARSEQMPEGHSYPEGAVRVYFDSLKITAAKPEMVRENDMPGYAQFSAKVTSASLECEFIAETMHDPKPAVDTAGNLRSDALVLKTAANDGAATSEEKEQWLEQAREERTSLAKTPNGQQLLMQYGKHNETYSDIMGRRSFQDKWKADGVTDRMSRDTSDALKNNKEINGKTYEVTSSSGKKRTISYNAHAFSQKTALVLTAAIMYDTTKDEKYKEAAEAADGFAHAMKSTGNYQEEGEDAQTKVMTPDDVYKSVDNYKPVKLLKSNANDVNSGLRMHSYYKNKFAAKNSAVRRPAANDAMEEPDRYGLEALYLSLKRETVEDANALGDIIFKGKCTATIDDFEAKIFSTQESCDVVFELPDIDLDINLDGCEPFVADIIRERLKNADFIKRLLHGSIKNGMEKWIAEIASEAL